MKLGRGHFLLTTALGGFGILAVLGTVPLPGTSPLQLVLETLVAAQLIVLVTRRDASSDALVFGLALAHFLAATLCGGGLAFLVAFAGLVMVLPAALVLSHLRREVEQNYQQGARDRTGSPVDVPRILRSKRVIGRESLAMLGTLPLPIVVLTAVFFLAVPRLGRSLEISWLTGHARTIGFRDRIDLSQGGKLEDSRETALRFRLSAEGGTPVRLVRFRGAVLEDFDGVKWGKGRKADADADAHANAHADEIEIEQGERDGAVTFLPVGTARVTVMEEKNGVALRYVARLGGANEDAIDQSERARDLALPRDLSPEIIALARAWTEGEEGDERKARAIERNLKTSYGYDLDSPSSGQPRPVDDFLFASKRGHCELFATSMVVMLRAVGIPARAVTGYIGGRYNRFGHFYAVRQGDAHAWVEAYVPTGTSVGFRTFDPTPSGAPIALETGVVASLRDLGDALAIELGGSIDRYDGATQQAVVRSPRVIATCLATCLVAGLVVLGLTRGSAFDRRRKGARAGAAAPNDARTDEATALYATLEDALVRHGITRDRAVPPLAHAEDLAARQHPLAEEVAALTNLYLEARFGGRALTDDVRTDFAIGVRRVLSWQPATA